MKTLMVVAGIAVGLVIGWIAVGKFVGVPQVVRFLKYAFRWQASTLVR